jgi:hypothetical protein
LVLLTRLGADFEFGGRGRSQERFWNKRRSLRFRSRDVEVHRVETATK